MKKQLFISIVFWSAIALFTYGGEKKLIGHSWDLLNVRPVDVARNLDAWEKVPLDGISLMIRVKLPDGSTASDRTIMNDSHWDKKAFAEEVKVIRQCASRNLKHNFLITGWAPIQRLAWNDDKAWERFAHNLGVAAWLAREGNAKGIFIDNEDYNNIRQFFWTAGDAPYAETAALARRRGAQVMKAMADEYPDITLLAFWLLSQNSHTMSDNPSGTIAAAGDLWVPFVNGMLDVLPPGAKIVDGNEHAYTYRAEKRDFYLASWQVQNKVLGSIAPENRYKYRTQVQSGFGLYLDMYTSQDPKSVWYFEEFNGSRLNRFRYNCSQALDAADEYVWLYGEKMDWINWIGTGSNQDNKGGHPLTRAGRAGNRTWEEMLPGFNETLLQLRHPFLWAEQAFKRQQAVGKLKNLLANGACIPQKTDGKKGLREGELPPGWGEWQDENKRQGVFGTDTGKGRGDRFSLYAESVERGSLTTLIPVLPGQIYAAQVFAQNGGRAVTIRWRKGGAIEWSLPSASLNFSATAQDGWQSAFGYIRVPDGAEELLIILSANLKEGERAWFDDAGLFLLTTEQELNK
ncbi:hypothetical protein [Limibacterium fermenti]|uniref:hypothetical protein n=1 Tax=Limibacterium fermenti TaxID=3229863 RepID=UPI003A6C5064